MVASKDLDTRLNRAPIAEPIAHGRVVTSGELGFFVQGTTVVVASKDLDTRLNRAPIAEPIAHGWVVTGGELSFFIQGTTMMVASKALDNPLDLAHGSVGTSEELAFSIQGTTMMVASKALNNPLDLAHGPVGTSEELVFFIKGTTATSSTCSRRFVVVRIVGARRLKMYGRRWAIVTRGGILLSDLILGWVAIAALFVASAPLGESVATSEEVKLLLECSGVEFSQRVRLRAGREHIIFRHREGSTQPREHKSR
jgi:hypothetical protein